MAWSAFQVALPRRVAAYYLLFCTLAAAWFGAGAVDVAQGVLQSRAETACLTRLGRASAAVSLALVREDPDAVQREVERIQREGGLAYCALVDTKQRYAAHSRAEQVGKPFSDEAVERVRWGDVERVRLTDGQGRTLREYRTPIKRGDQPVGWLHLAVAEPGWSDTIWLTAQHAPLALLGALGVIAAGALVTYRAVRPAAEIERQLSELARAPSLADVPLRPVAARSAAALGWNRLLRERRPQEAAASLEERLQEAVQSLGRQKSDQVLNSLSDGVLVSDAEGRVTFANQAAAALLETGPDPSLEGRPVREVLGFAAERPEAAPLFDPQLAARAAVAEVARGEGAQRQVLRIARHPMRSCQGRQGGGHVWSIRDITQQKLAEEARDQFLDAATHELRTPLANIKAYAETLSLSDLRDVEQQKEFCNTINAEATRLARLIDDLLSVSSMEVGSLSLNIQETNVDRLLRECVGKVRAQMEKKRLGFDCVFPEKLPTIRLDKDKVAAAVVNLLGNAAKYTPEGGRVTLRVRLVDDRLRIEVQDTGVGISKEELPRVFDKFFRSADARIQNETGTGLGLAFAQEVVRLHDGVLTVESELNKGSTFTMQLPVR